MKKPENKSTDVGIYTKTMYLPNPSTGAEGDIRTVFKQFNRFEVNFPSP